MCMTTPQHPASSGYAAALPYTQETLPMLPCQLVAFGESRESSSSPSTSSLKGPTSLLSWPSKPTPSLPTAGPTASSSTTSSTSVSERVLQTLRKSTGTRRPLSKPRQQQQQPSLPLPLRRPCQNPHQRFAAFVAILLLHLKGAKNTKNYKLTMQTKALIAECCRRHDMGDANFTPLPDSLSERLRGLVGVPHWECALRYLQTYLERHHAFCLRTDALEEDRRLLHYHLS